MKFYKVDFSHDVKILGTSGLQIQGIDPRCKYHVDAPYSFWKIKVNEPIKEHIRIPDMLLAKKAKWTDLMSSSMMGYLFRIISDKFYNLLSEHNVHSHQAPDIKLSKNDISKIYKALYFHDRFDNEFVNWEECSFGLVDKKYAPKKEILERFSFENGDEFSKMYSKVLRQNKFKIKSLVVRYNRNIELDFFKCLYPDIGYFCSEHLKDRIEELNLTGFRFEEVTDLEKPYWSIDHLGESNKSNNT